jgi:hypothetical protein
MSNPTVVPALVALVSLFTSAQSVQSVPAAEGRLEVLRGRVVLRQEGQAERLVRPDEEIAWPAKSGLEIGAGAQARLSWAGTASWQVWGPALLEWSPSDSTSSSVTGLRFSVHDLAWADVEIRRGEHRLDLPGHWSAKLESGALHLRSLPAGPMEIRYHAGTPLELLWSGDADHVRPPVTVYPGSSLRLERPPEGPADQTRGANAWGQPTWPWSSTTDSRADAEQRPWLAERNQRQAQGAAPWPTERGGETSSRVSEFPAPGSVHVEVLPPTRPRDPRATTTTPPSTGSTWTSPRTGASTTTPPPSRVSPYGSPRAPGVGASATSGSGTSSTSGTSTPNGGVATTTSGDVAAAPARPVDPWRGHRQQDYLAAGSVWVQRSRDVEVRALDEGRWKVLVDSAAQGKFWCLGPELDWSLPAGAVAVFEADGRLRVSLGAVEQSPARSGRPSPKSK